MPYGRRSNDPRYLPISSVSLPTQLAIAIFTPAVDLAGFCERADGFTYALPPDQRSAPP